MLAVGGVGAALTGETSIGDLVIASQVTGGGASFGCASAPLLAGELRRAGLRAVVGPVATVDRLLRQGDHAALAASGAIAADMESPALLGCAAGRPARVVPAISDPPG